MLVCEEEILTSESRRLRQIYWFLTLQTDGGSLSFIKKSDSVSSSLWYDGGSSDFVDEICLTWSPSITAAASSLGFRGSCRQKWCLLKQWRKKKPCKVFLCLPERSWKLNTPASWRAAAPHSRPSTGCRWSWARPGESRTPRGKSWKPQKIRYFQQLSKSYRCIVCRRSRCWRSWMRTRTSLFTTVGNLRYNSQTKSESACVLLSL